MAPLDFCSRLEILVDEELIFEHNPEEDLQKGIKLAQTILLIIEDLKEPPPLEIPLIQGPHNRAHIHQINLLAGNNLFLPLHQFINLQIARNIDLHYTIPLVIDVIDVEETFGEFLFGVRVGLEEVGWFWHEEDGEVLGVGVEALEEAEGVALFFWAQEGGLFGEGVDGAVAQTEDGWV